MSEHEFYTDDCRCEHCGERQSLFCPACLEEAEKTMRVGVTGQTRRLAVEALRDASAYHRAAYSTASDSQHNHPNDDRAKRLCDHLMSFHQEQARQFDEAIKEIECMEVTDERAK